MDEEKKEEIEIENNIEIEPEEIEEEEEEEEEREKVWEKIDKRLNEIEGLQIIASGGISFEHEIETLNNMGIYGAILGKALYENKLNLKKALEICR